MAGQPKLPCVYVIAGPNGAGKTTFASKFLPDFVQCREFLNADLIAQGLSPFAPELQNVEAGKLLLRRMDELASRDEDFSFETTRAGRGHARRLEALKLSGYQVHIFFLWLPDEEFAVSRVANRVRQGGHKIAEKDIRRRYHAGLKNFFDLYAPLANFWRMYDASIAAPQLVAQMRSGSVEVANLATWRIIHERLAGGSTKDDLRA